MAKTAKQNDKQPQPAKPAGFDRGSQDFFRGSRGMGFNGKVNNRTFIGMRRGSR